MNITSTIRPAAPALFLAGLALLAACQCDIGGSGQKFTRAEHFDVPATGITALEIENVNGNILLTAWDQESISVDVTRFVRSETEAEAKQTFDANPFAPQTENSTVVLRWEIKEKEGCRTVFGIPVGDSFRGGADYVVKAPARFIAQIDSVNGAVEANGLTGGVVISTVNGEITGQQIGGITRVDTVNGSIQLSGLTGGFEVETVNGSIQIEVASLLKDGASNVETVNGSATVTLPTGAGVHLSAETVNGGIDAPSGVKVEKSGPIGRNVDADLNGGGHHLQMETVNGRIEIRLGASTAAAPAAPAEPVPPAPSAPPAAPANAI